MRLLDDAQAGHAREIPIGQHHVVVLVLDEGQGLVAIGRCRHVERAAQELRNQLAPRAFHLDHQHAALLAPAVLVHTQAGLRTRELFIAAGKRATDAETQSLHIADRFLDVVLRPDVQGLHRGIIGRVSGNHHHSGLGIERARHAQDLEARCSRQVLVREHQIEMPLVHQIDGFFG